jgi:Nucleotide modification associated domain 2
MAVGVDRGDDHMSLIWRYSLVHDTGLAPCIDDDILTLTVCKPDIRKAASKGDWVIGFVTAKVRRGLVAWVGRVSDIMTMGEYGNRFAGRTDALYKLDGYAWGGSEILRHLQSAHHADEKSQATDRKGKNALVFDPFWYWGTNAVDAPDDIADLAHYHVGQSSKRSSPERVARLEAWVRSVTEPGIHGSPRDAERLEMSIGIEY